MNSPEHGFEDSGEVQDATFDEFLDKEISALSQHQMSQLDQSMRGAFDEKPAVQKRGFGHFLESFFSQQPAVRVILSYGIVAALFFVAGVLIPYGGEDPSDSNLAEAELTELTQMKDFSAELYFTQYEEAVQIAGPVDQDAEELFQSYLDDNFLPDPSVSSLTMPGSEADEETSDAAPEESYSARIATEFEIETYAQFYDGILYVLTPHSVLGIGGEQIYILIDELESPEGIMFDEEGNLLVADRVGGLSVLYLLKRIDDQEESDSE